MVNFTHQLCNITTILTGIWHLGSKIEKNHDPWKACPATLAHVQSQTQQVAGTCKLNDQQGKYSCYKQEYQTAHYETPNCLFLSLSESLKVVGDYNVLNDKAFADVAAYAVYEATNNHNHNIHHRSTITGSRKAYSLTDDLIMSTKKLLLGSVSKKNNSIEVTSHSRGLGHSNDDTNDSNSTSNTPYRFLKGASSSSGKKLNKKDEKSSESISSKSQQSYKQVKKPVKRIFYIGDSLITESYIAAKCVLEHYQKNLQHNIEVSYTGEVFLRDDIPCDSRCINNASMYLPYQGELQNPCWACADGKPRTWEEYMLKPSSWMNRITNDTVAIVMGGGTWFNGYKMLMNSTAAYIDTLHKVKPIFQEFIEKHRITVFWQGLVPTITEHLQQLNLTEMYGWAYFDEKDHLAKSILTPIGVQFVNVSALTRERKYRDLQLTADPIHWCSPGTHSVPTFLNHVYFHMLASRYITQN